jgi:hypothetical protein
MPRLEVPLKHRTLFATGDILLRAELLLLVRDHAGVWHPENFRVDYGSEITTMSAHRAKKLGLPLPKQATPGVVHHPTALEIRSGYLRVTVPGLDATEYTFPCFFLGDPNKLSPRQPPAAVPRSLLGLSGVVNQLLIYCDGTPSPGAIHGNLIVETK